MSLVVILANAGEAAERWHFQLPPLHPILVNFTAALIPASLLSDLLGRVTRKQSLVSAGWWMLLYAAIVTPFTALAGWLWLRQMPGMDVRAMWVHQWLGTALAAVLVPLAFWRGRMHVRSRAVSVAYLVVASLLTTALVVQGHLGGSMSFGASDSDGDSHAATTPHAMTPPATSNSEAVPPTTTQPHDHNWRDHLELRE